MPDAPYKVFISHSSQDTWVARQFARVIHAHGGDTFLDEADIDYGDDIEDRLLEAARSANELLVLFTPWALARPYVWLEIGAVWGLGKRVVGVLHGLSQGDLQAQDGTPVLLKRIDLVQLNDVDSYLDQVMLRISSEGVS